MRFTVTRSLEPDLFLTLAAFGPSPPKPPPPPPPPPQRDDAAEAADAANRLRRRKGRAATVLTSPDLAPPNVGTRTLLGG